MTGNSKAHWDLIYNNKQPYEVSWTQDKPQISLDFLNGLNISKTSKIIDIGGGDSKLVDYLLKEGFTNVTVLDISETAIERAKVRLREAASKVNWIVTDILDFEPVETYDIWHDRAAFHFLTTNETINKYIDIAGQCVSGYLIVGTFSDEGPRKCSGLEISQYNESSLEEKFYDSFELIQCKREDHVTPLGTKQNFLFCSFKRR